MILQCPTTGWLVQPAEIFRTGLARQRFWRCPVCDAGGRTIGQPGYKAANPQIHGAELSPLQAIAQIAPLIMVERVPARDAA